MAESDRSQAQRRRADARRQRRVDKDGGSEQQAGTADAAGDDERSDEESHAALKNAAKVAAAGAAVGAAVAAALGARDPSDEDRDDEPRPDHVAESDTEGSPVGAVQQAEEKEEKPEDGEAERPLEAAGGDEPASPPATQPADRDSGEPQRGASPDETVDIAMRARQQLQALHGREPESVSSLARTAEGWAVTLEVVELQRVPDSTDVMASYELLLDGDKNLVRYERRRRYYRSQADRGGES